MRESSLTVSGWERFQSLISANYSENVSNRSLELMANCRSQSVWCNSSTRDVFIIVTLVICGSDEALGAGGSILPRRQLQTGIASARRRAIRWRHSCANHQEVFLRTAPSPQQHSAIRPAEGTLPLGGAS